MRGLVFAVLSAVVVGGGVGASKGCALRGEPPPLYIRDVWVDATGKEVASAGALYHVDSEGRVYPLDAETGQPTDSNLSMASGYERSDCTGPLLVAHVVAPRVPFSLGDGLGYRVREDGAASGPASFQSRRLTSGECQEYQVPMKVLRAFEAPPPTLPGLPVLPHLGPLHLERRP